MFRALSFRFPFRRAAALRAVGRIATLAALLVILFAAGGLKLPAADKRDAAIIDYRLQEVPQDVAGTAATSADERPNPLRRAKTAARATQAAYNVSAEQPAYQRSPIDYFEASSATQEPPAFERNSTAPVRRTNTGPANYSNAYPPSQAPGIFQSRPAAYQSYDSQLPRNMPSPAANFAEQTSPQACEDCAPDYSSGSNYSGGPNSQNNLHALPGPGVPEAYQVPHYPRALGFGEPLAGTSWQNRPFHVNGFTGSMIGDDAIDSQVGQEAGFFIGTRVGWDYDYYWGVETRLGLAWMSLFDRQNPENNIGTGNIIVWDMSLLYYPWGDSRWRPFLLLGLGIQQLDSYGSSPAVYSGTLAELPFGIGMKYRMNEWMVFRFDVIDNLAFGTGSLDTMHNVSLTAGLEYHFGGKRRNYWPWNPNPKH